MDVNEQINEMVQALEEAMVVQQKYADALAELKEENQFLADTITNNKLGKISTERRQLLARVTNAESDSKTAISEADAIKSEYEQKLDKITILIKDVKSKQADIDAYIDSEAENKVADAKADYIKHKKANDKALVKHKAENDALLQEQLNKYKQQHKIIIICGVIGIIVGIFGWLL